jgi:hypothetical protein
MGGGAGQGHHRRGEEMQGRGSTAMCWRGRVGTERSAPWPRGTERARPGDATEGEGANRGAASWLGDQCAPLPETSRFCTTSPMYLLLSLSHKIIQF